MDVNRESEVDVEMDDVVGQCSDNKYFDNVIGHIEDIIMSASFHEFLENFFENNYKHFDYYGENKSECMNIFQEYSSMFEKFFVITLNKRMDDFNMERFNHELSSRQRIARNDINFIESEIYELLDSCNNYDTFKGLILDYRLQKEGRYRNLQDFKILTVSKAFDDKLD